jgi:hypothetical protein
MKSPAKKLGLDGRIFVPKREKTERDSPSVPSVSGNVRVGTFLSLQPDTVFLLGRRVQSEQMATWQRWYESSDCEPVWRERSSKLESH